MMPMTMLLLLQTLLLLLLLLLLTLVTMAMLLMLPPPLRSTIIGATTPEQLKENLDVFRLPSLNPAILDRIDQVYLDNRDPSLED